LIKTVILMNQVMFCVRIYMWVVTS